MKGLELCEEVVRRAKAKGADEAEVYYLRTRKLEAVFEKNDLQVPKGDTYEGIGVRVIRDARLGFAATNVLTRETIDDTIQAALAIAAASPPDVNHVFPEPSEVTNVPGVHDERATELALDDAVELGSRFVEAARGYDRRVTIDAAGFVAQAGERALANSRGVRAFERVSNFSCTALGFAREGDDVSSFDVEYCGSCNLDDIDLAASGRRLAEKVVKSLGATTIPSFRGTVIVTPYAGGELIAQPVAFSAAADNVQEGRSRWHGKLATSVASVGLTVVDDPRIPAGLGSTSFDREGVPPQRLEIIKDGVLCQYLHNCYTARKDGVRSNGRAVGSDQTTPGIGTTNLVIAPGTVPLEDMIRDTAKGLVVNRFSGNLDPVSGDFSGVVKGGQYIENGEVVKPVKEVMIAGNIYELLSRIAAVSMETVTLGEARLPYIQLEGVSVTGK
ncbi:MAG: TldD/PmbA family protein [Firmicutes bacterium]|jgi:PmbA protein|nr:TldD/PmbA family protein [Bacillota bacterium]MDH7496677.1 TldD/PmbA family protein [Bacillota bacterium]